MAVISGKTAGYMQQVIDNSLVDADVDVNGNLIFTRQNGTTVNAGNVRGPQGVPGSGLSAYAIGAIYVSESSTHPATLFGGTWVAYAAGRVIVGIDAAQSEFNAPAETGGAKTHTLTDSEGPAHVHDMTHGHSSDSRGGTGGSTVAFARSDASTIVTGGGMVKTASGNTGSNSAATPHNNLQPYIVCYMWKRTA